MILVFSLLLLGFGLVAAEVFFPSAGLLSLVAGCTLIGSVILAFQESSGLGWLVLIIALVGLPLVVVLAFRVFPRTPAGRRMIQGGATWGKGERAAIEHPIARFVGQRGVAISPLRPSGIAQFGDERVDVISRGDHVPAGTEVLALRFEANRLVVEVPHPSSESPQSA